MHFVSCLNWSIKTSTKMAPTPPGITRHSGIDRVIVVVKDRKEVIRSRRTNATVSIVDLLKCVWYLKPSHYVARVIFLWECVFTDCARPEQMPAIVPGVVQHLWLCTDSIRPLVCSRAGTLYFCTILQSLRMIIVDKQKYMLFLHAFNQAIPVLRSIRKTYWIIELPENKHQKFKNYESVINRLTYVHLGKIKSLTGWSTVCTNCDVPQQ